MLNYTITFASPWYLLILAVLGVAIGLGARRVGTLLGLGPTGNLGFVDLAGIGAGTARTSRTEHTEMVGMARHVPCLRARFLDFLWCTVLERRSSQRGHLMNGQAMQQNVQPAKCGQIRLPQRRACLSHVLSPYWYGTD